MASYIRISFPEAESGVGNVFTDIEILNHEDEVLARNGHIQASEIRRIELSNVLVDTGANVLCLPKSLGEQLGLPSKERVVASTASGEIEAGVFAEASLRVAGRETVAELGVIPLQAMGLEVDLHRHELRVLPNDSKDTYIFAY